MTAFDCNRCGACCRLVGLVVSELDRGDGAYRHLEVLEDGTHACGIYETRPKACRVDENVPPAMQLAEWQRRNSEMCGHLRLAVYGGE